MEISVIIPTYQHADAITKCLDNIFIQTKQPVEIIVVNDGSTDNTVEVLKPYMDKIELINQKNQGANVARNRGFEASRGDAVIFCDADLIMRPDMLEKMADALSKHPEAGYAYCNFRFGAKRFDAIPFDPVALRRRNYIHTSALIRREVFPGFDPSIKRLQDWDLWLTMLEKGKQGVYIPEKLFDINMEWGRDGISTWLPSFVYKIPWPILGWTPKAVRSYNKAARVIQEKHDL